MMELKEVREVARMARKYGDEDNVTDDMIIILDDRITELEGQFNIAQQTAKDNAIALGQQQEIVEKGAKILYARIAELEAQRDELLEAIAKAEGQRNVLFGLCEDALVKCPFPVGASLLREKLQTAVEQIEDGILNTQEGKEIKQPAVRVDGPMDIEV